MEARYYKVKVVNCPHGLYYRKEPNGEKLGSYKNGDTLVIDKQKQVGNRVWYRNTYTGKWSCAYDTGTRTTYLKIITGLTGEGAVKVDANKQNATFMHNIKNSGVLKSSTSASAKASSSSTEGTVKYNIVPKVTGKDKLAKSGNNTSLSSSKVSKDTIQFKHVTRKQTVMHRESNNADYPKFSKNNKRHEYTYDYYINIGQSIEDDIQTIKENIGASTAYSRKKLTKLMYHNFNRYHLNFPDFDLRSLVPYVVFTRPDLNLFKSDWSLLDQTSNDPQLYYILKNDLEVGKTLTSAFNGNHDFNPLLTNRVLSLDVDDDSLEYTEVGENLIGFKMQYAKTLLKSKTAGTFSIKYKESYNLALTHLHQIWCTYENNVYRGSMEPKSKYIGDKIIDYACDIYYFLMDPSTYTIRFWTKYYGVFPISVSKTIFSYDEGSLVQFPELNVTYGYFTREDFSPFAITEFNNNSLGTSNNFEYIMDYEKKLGHSGKTWAGVPFIEATEETNAFGGTSDIFKLRFREL